MAEKTGSSDQQLIARNRRAQFEYELGDRFEAGLVLIGSEVRSLRDKTADLTDAWIDIDHRHEAWVKGLRIAPLPHAAFGHEERRTRKLLLNAKEIEQLRSAVDREGMTIVATRCYFKANRAKLEIALARGKKKHDKRQAIKERDAEREARVAMRRGRDG